MRIGEMVRSTGVSARMLRYYEQQGLLQPARHGNGYREYGDSDLEQVLTIRDLADSGVPTRFIRIILDRQSGRVGWTSRCDADLAVEIGEQIADLDAKIRCLTDSRAALTRLVDEAHPVRSRGGRPRQPARRNLDDSAGGHGAAGQEQVPATPVSRPTQTVAQEVGAAWR